MQGTAFADGKSDSVRVVPWTIRPLCFKKVDSNIKLRPRFLTKVVESASWGNLHRGSWKFAFSSEKETKTNEGFSRSPTVLCFGPICCSTCDTDFFSVPCAIQTKLQIFFCFFKDNTFNISQTFSYCPSTPLEFPIASIVPNWSLTNLNEPLMADFLKILWPNWWSWIRSYSVGKLEQPNAFIQDLMNQSGG